MNHSDSQNAIEGHSSGRIPRVSILISPAWRESRYSGVTSTTSVMSEISSIMCVIFASPSSSIRTSAPTVYLIFLSTRSYSAYKLPIVKIP